MLNRKLLALVLPAVAVSALVGSGFSAWYFNEENIQGVDKDVNVFITDKVDDTVGTLTLDAIQATTLTLDQGGWTNSTALNKGISFDEVSVGATFTFKESDSFTNLDSAGMKVQITTTVTFTAELLEYVNVIGLDPTHYTRNLNVYTRTQDVPVAGLTDTIKLMLDGNCTFLTYNEGKKPQNPEDYEAMKSALTNAKINFAWSAEVVAK